jgi:predicted transcriptional regulator of viral defense system
MSQDTYDAATARQDAGAWQREAERVALTGQTIRERAATHHDQRAPKLNRAGWLLESAAADLAAAAKKSEHAARLLDPTQPRAGHPARRPESS